jgi:hypothetical protein
MAFLIRLFELRGRQVAVSTIAEIYSRIIRKVITQFNQEAFERRTAIFGSISGHLTSWQLHTISASQCMRTLEHCEVLSLDDAVCSLFQKIEDAASNAGTEDFKMLLLPYLGLLLAHLQERASSSILTNDCVEHVRIILQAYIIRYVGPQPRQPANWSHSVGMVQCGCRDSLELKAFVKDGARKTYEFRMAQSPATKERNLKAWMLRELTSQSAQRSP